MATFYSCIFLYVVYYLKSCSAQTCLNVALSRYGGNCTASTSMSMNNNSYVCTEALNGNKTSGDGWQTTASNIVDQHIDIILPRPYNISRFGLQPFSMVNVPRVVYITIDTDAGHSEQYNILMANSTDMQVFSSLCKGGTCSPISQIGVNVVKVNVLISSVYNLEELTSGTGFTEVEFFQQYSDVRTATPSIICSFPFTSSGNEYYHCHNFSTTSTPQCLTEGDGSTKYNCIYNNTVCGNVNTPVIGPPQVEQEWCLGQSGCYNSATGNCHESTHSCQPDYFGDICQDVCNCENSSLCHPVDGANSSSCPCKSSHTLVDNKCIGNKAMTVKNLTIDRVNSGQMTSMTCVADGVPVPSATDLTLSRIDSPTVDVSGNRTSTSRVGTERMNAYSVRVASGQNYKCQVTGGNEKSKPALTYQNPALLDPPVATIQSTSVTIQWTGWLAGHDEGDGPVVKYIVLMKNAADQFQDHGEVPVSSEMRYTYDVSSLTAGETYTFAIACERQGPGGRGVDGKSLQVTTAGGSNGTVTGLTVGLVIAGVIIVGLIVGLVILARKRKAVPKKDIDSPRPMVSVSTTHVPKPGNKYVDTHGAEQAPKQHDDEYNWPLAAVAGGSNKKGTNNVDEEYSRTLSDVAGGPEQGTANIPGAPGAVYATGVTSVTAPTEVYVTGMPEANSGAPTGVYATNAT